MDFFVYSRDAPGAEVLRDDAGLLEEHLRPFTGMLPPTPKLLSWAKSGARCFGTPRNRSKSSSEPSSQTATLRSWSSDAIRLLRNELDPTLAERLEQRLRRVRRWRDRLRERHHHPELAVVAGAALGEMVVEEQRRLARRGRALERRAADTDHSAAGREGRHHVAQVLRAARRYDRTRCKRSFSLR
jgi:hypothetical protein